MQVVNPCIAVNQHSCRRVAISITSHASSVRQISRTRPVASRNAEREKSLLQNHGSLYPRLKTSINWMQCSDFRVKYGQLRPKDRLEDLVTISGKIHSIRTSSSKLIFLDVEQNRAHLQILCNYSSVCQDSTLEEFKQSLRCLQKGDFIQVTGHPERTSASRNFPEGELSIRISQLPTLLAPSLQLVPQALKDAETRIHKRHVDLQMNGNIRDTLVFRSRLIQYVRNFLLCDGQVEVQTPILASGIGGALARPFTTTAFEFAEKPIKMRIAPELWLKRLVVGGFDRIFEIGPSFRNEGIDASHNPEFTTCEFYRTYTTLETLLELSETLLAGIHQCAKNSINCDGLNIEVPSIDFNGPYRRLDFIKGIEEALGTKLPDLESPSAIQEVAKILLSNSIEVAPDSTLPQMLDKLSQKYLESQCQRPTWIVHPPECLSPLSKSFRDKSGQLLAARAELFVEGRELINTYEEENSPEEQRQKFVRQLQYRNEENHSTVDESYLEALEWGMPPTGGWGAGIDRICMLMTGTTRISDVLAFGSLRNVVSLGR